MTYFARIVLLGALVSFLRFSEGCPTSQTKDLELIHDFSVELNKLFTNFCTRESWLGQIEYLDPLPIPGGYIDLSSLGFVDLSGHLKWEESEITGLSKVNLATPEWAENTEAGTANLKWNGDIPSLLIKIPVFDLNIRYSYPSINRIVLTAYGSDFVGGINSFAASLHAEGPFNEGEVRLADLFVDIGIQFEIKGEGRVTINRETASFSYVSGSLNTLFASVWNGWNKPLIENYLKCAINEAVDGCTSTNIDACQGFPGFGEYKCLDELREFKLDPNVNSARNVVVSVFSKALMLFAIIWKFY